jgi:hypothetical protein
VSGIIIEGVTGAGKTSSIKALRSLAPFDLIEEEATFGAFRAEFAADADAASERARQRLDDILTRIEREKPRSYVLERFHFSQIALGSEWRRYREIDRRCAACGIKAVVLVLPEDRLLSRSLYRCEYDGTDWQNLIQVYGSEAKALHAIRFSQQTRLDAIRQSELTGLLIDTTDKDWRAYAKTVAEIFLVDDLSVVDEQYLSVGRTTVKIDLVSERDAAGNGGTAGRA